MLDLKYVVQNLDLVREKLATRHAEDTVEPLIPLAEKRRELIGNVESLRAELNAANKEMAALAKAKDQEGLQAKRGELKELSERIKAIDPELKAVEGEIEAVLLSVPNLPLDETSVGESENDNPVLRTVGEPTRFDFDAKWHDELGAKLGILDTERGAKIAGARFTVLMGAGARLERALYNFFLDIHTAKHGYTEVLAPFLVNSKTMTGTGQLPKFEEDLFKVAGDWDLYLIPTAEVPLTNLHSDEILDEDDLPLRMCGLTACFRSEAGSYGKDVRGYIRQHQFNKVELVHLCTPETSRDEHLKLLEHAETILQLLELPYRIVELCTGDLGFGAARCYDLEVWLPMQEKYREISSCSNCGDFQARRMNLRYRPKGKKAKPRFCHTLNGSGLAVGRTVVAILENYQQPDGSVMIPEVLRPYMGGIERIG